MKGEGTPTRATPRGKRMKVARGGTRQHNERDRASYTNAASYDDLRHRMQIQLQSGRSDDDGDRKRDRNGEWDEPSPDVQDRLRHSNADTSIHYRCSGRMAARIPDPLLRDQLIAGEEAKLEGKNQAKGAPDGDDPRHYATSPTRSGKYQPRASDDRYDHLRICAVGDVRCTHG